EPFPFVSAPALFAWVTDRGGGRDGAGWLAAGRAVLHVDGHVASLGVCVMSCRRVASTTAVPPTPERLDAVGDPVGRLRLLPLAAAGPRPALANALPPVPAVKVPGRARHGVRDRCFDGPRRPLVGEDLAPEAQHRPQRPTMFRVTG